jgi:ribosomal protein L37AE/L43A
MGAIKDVVDITTQLANSVQDRKVSAEIFKIQSLILSVQKDDAELVSENLDLKKKIFEFEKEIFNLQNKHAGEISNLQNKILALEEKFSANNLQDKYVFAKELGIYKSKESGHYFCTSCLMKNIESPLTEKQSGWHCELKDCGKFYSNPSYHPQIRRRPIY